MSTNLYAPLDWSSIANTVATIERCAVRIAIALVGGIVRSPLAAGKEALNALSLDNLWALALIVTCYLLGTVIGGPIGVVVNAVLIGLAIYELPDTAIQIARGLKDGFVGAIEAKNEQDLDNAGDKIAQALGKLEFELLVIVGTHRLFLAAKAVLLRRFRVPAVLEVEYRKAKAKAEANNKAKVRAAAELAAMEKRKASLRSAAELAAAAGVKPAAQKLPQLDLPSVAGAALAVLAVAGAVAAVAVVASSRGEDK